jgi:hypothetical protein
MCKTELWPLRWVLSGRRLIWHPQGPEFTPTPPHTPAKEGVGGAAGFSASTGGRLVLTPAPRDPVPSFGLPPRSLPFDPSIWDAEADHPVRNTQ